ncbi:MAG: CorA family divalent cation transporter [Bacillota bacterium]|nr:CorA family divalent cation transporter [Bacillota bacterium]
MKCFIYECKADNKNEYYGIETEVNSEDEILEKYEIELSHQTGKASTKFESHHGFDYISLDVPVVPEILENQKNHIRIFFVRQRILFFYDDYVNIAFIKELFQNAKDGSKTPEFLLQDFFNLLTIKDNKGLQSIESSITNLEDNLISTETFDCTHDIIVLRKRLLALKQYYEALYEVLASIEENENQLFTPHELKYFSLIADRVDRLIHSVINLRDYVTQVREAYQAQVDISLNKTMKLFTVITAIFLPLTLLAGWYGMNLKMPEYNFAYGYPVVIAVSVAIVVGLMIYFKKHKWV